MGLRESDQLLKFSSFLQNNLLAALITVCETPSPWQADTRQKNCILLESTGNILGNKKCLQTPLIGTFGKTNVCFLSLLKKIFTATTISTSTLLETHVHEVYWFFHYRDNNTFFQIIPFIKDFKVLNENIFCLFTLHNGSQHSNAWVDTATKFNFLFWP